MGEVCIVLLTQCAIDKVEMKGGMSCRTVYGGQSGRELSYGTVIKLFQASNETDLIYMGKCWALPAVVTCCV